MKEWADFSSQRQVTSLVETLWSGLVSFARPPSVAHSAAGQTATVKSCSAVKEKLARQSNRVSQRPSNKGPLCRQRLP